MGAILDLFLRGDAAAVGGGSGGGSGGSGAGKTNPFTPMVSLPAVNMVSTLCALLEGLLTPKRCPPEGPKEVRVIAMAFVGVPVFYNIRRLWSPISYLHVSGHSADPLVETKLACMMPAEGKHSAIGGGVPGFTQTSLTKVFIANKLGDSYLLTQYHWTGLVFDYFVDPESKKFVPWEIPVYSLLSSGQEAAPTGPSKALVTVCLLPLTSPIIHCLTSVIRKSFPTLWCVGKLNRITQK